ncbi:MAG: hypothetical protein IPK28_22790 [Devosia sp.]|nr:hypothetical protein [Devosia sp.]
MDKIFTWLRSVLSAFVVEAPDVADPIGRMSARDLADLPVWHPCCEDGAAPRPLNSR